MITDVGLDLDGVLFDFSSAVTDSFSRILGRELPAPTTWEFYKDWGLRKEEFYALLATVTVDDELFDHGSPINGTVQGWELLRALGVNIHIITHRSMLAMNQTTKWLERYNLIPDGLYFTGDKALVLSSIAEEQAVAVDDHYDHYLDYHLMGLTAFVFHQPWNKDYSARRVHSLQELAQYIESHNNYALLEDKYHSMTRKLEYESSF